VVIARNAGIVHQLDAGELGVAAFVLGAGRRRAEDPVDPAVGLWIDVTLGQQVEVGQPLVRILHREGRALEEALLHVRRAIRVADEDPEPWPLLMERLRDDGETG
jgi:thymidine phosphorylase